MLGARKQLLMLWIGAVLVSSLVLSLFLPTPVGIGLFILWGFFVYISLVLRKLLAQQYKNLYNISNNASNDNTIENSIIKYHCMLCGKYHNDKSCPICGSKMKKATF